MKTLKLKLLIMVLLLIGAVACNKYGTLRRVDVGPYAVDVSNNDAANLIAGSLAVNSYGVAIISSNVAFNSQSIADAHVACGTTKKDTVKQQSAPGARTTYNYNSTFSYTLNCNSSNQPDNTATNSVYSGSYSSASFSSSNSGSSVFAVTGLSPTSTQSVVNGEFKQAGSFQSATNTSDTGKHAIDIVLQNLTFTKATRKIASGNATIAVSGTTPNKGTFSYNGSLVFNGDNTATLILNNVTYKIDLITGIVTKA